MKKRIQLHILLLAVLLFAGCKKNTTPATPVNGAACKPTSESTTLSGNNDTYKYTYDAGGKISTITKFPTAFPGALKDSIIVTDLGKTSYSQTSAYPVEAHTNWGSYFNQLPPSASVSITERGVTQVNYWVYQFTYDTKNRLVEVNESTPTQIGDYEYDLSIAYNDKDNVSSLRYSNSTGPVTILKNYWRLYFVPKSSMIPLIREIESNPPLNSLSACSCIREVSLKIAKAQYFSNAPWGRYFFIHPT